jgi:hypothetical protein
MFDNLRRSGALHIFLADASPDFIEALSLGASDIVYRDMREWKKAALASALRGSTWFVDKPGEVLLTEDIYKGQRSLLPIIVAVRARGGKVLRLGIGQRKANAALTPKFRRLYSLANAVAWRDPESARAFGIGQVMPDWGFEPVSGATASAPRSALVLSYRGDRPILSESTRAAIATFAAERSLEIVVVTQVARDEERTSELAALLGASTLAWEPGVTHADQEARLRELFGRAAVVASDRLHVLIVGATEGAVPINLVDQPDVKVARHFDAIGYSDLSIVATDVPSDAVVGLLAEQAARADEIRDAVTAARATIAGLVSKVLAQGAGR